MDSAMIAIDAAVCAASALYLTKAFGFIKAARRNAEDYRDDLVIQEHFSDHLWACSVGLLGGMTAFGFSILHFIAQNLINTCQENLDHIEYGMDIGIIIVLFSGVMFMAHMTREETKGHPFYVQEYGDE